MRTQDVIKLGIDRNFLRQCEDKHHLINPKRDDGVWINDESYKPRDYSQEEIEIVWNALLCRKMGLSFEQIKKLINGEEIRIRDSLNELIEKYKRQIEELKVIIEFMQYVKGVGFIPNPPKSLMGSNSFIEYLTDYIKYLDPEGKMKQVINIAESISNMSDIETIGEDEIDNIELVSTNLAPHFSETDRDEYAATFMLLKDKTNLDPASKEIQNIIHKIFDYQKKLNNTSDLTAWNFAVGLIVMISNNSDLSETYKKLLGESTCDFFVDALIQFLIKEEPEKVESIYKQLEKPN